MKIAKLFEAYNSQVNGTHNVGGVFSESGMVNKFQKLEFGFFPLGSGIFSNKCKIEEAEIETGGIMVLGNDFGTCDYLNECYKNDKKEDRNKNPTIRNLLKLELKHSNTFYTNFYLGVRDDENYEGVKNTSKVFFTDQYKEFCLNFFIKQLEFVKPSIVICLGKPVRFVLCDFFETVFPEDIKRKGTTYNKLFEKNGYEVAVKDMRLGERQFIFIPHPSWAHRNWTPAIRSKIETFVAEANR